MATIKKLSAVELGIARRSGYKKKKPKKPRAGASLTVLENYVVRFNEWVDGARAKIKERAKKESDAKKRVALSKAIRQA